ncbi:hypothetical protein PRIPAC_96201 [Pristionchus pacificus]|uniref:Zinc finger protein n=1 Tax=Pristionchus pacificus TaxID=54126 RepID=A0A2A6BCH9_PRIPA|nr:hypothetical protein PRIPAC_96201 [Pristionchus pacificus]|eukprot:PDM63599.1 zinc finger protein [Pristionchus pacificus]
MNKEYTSLTQARMGRQYSPTVSFLYCILLPQQNLKLYRKPLPHPHLGVGRQFTCSHKGCKKVYTSIGNLNKHAAIHRNNAQPFECTLCGKEFRKKDGLQKHQLTHLDADAKPSFKCETCHKTLASRQMLELHTKTIHMGERPFKCSKCDKAFTRKCRLRDHLNTHKSKICLHYPDYPKCTHAIFVQTLRISSIKFGYNAETQKEDASLSP